jgi:glycosyltransferase involved in cell wall biosynthesis
VTISVGLPFCNNQSTLPLAIRSVFAQERSDWELLLLDDGSTDGSLALARSIEDPRVRVLADGNNRGLAVRLNELAQEARGEWIVRMDADDAMHPQRLATQIGFLEANRDVDLVASHAYLMTKDEHVYGIGGDRPMSDDPALFLGRLVIVHPTVAARTKWMLENPYDPTFRKAQDKELFCRTHPHSVFAKTEEPLLFYREAGAMTLDKYRATRATDRRIIGMYASRLGRGHAAMEWLKTYAKVGVFGAFALVNQAPRFERWLAARRSTELSPEQQREAAQALERIRTTEVPGLES